MSDTELSFRTGSRKVSLKGWSAWATLAVSVVSVASAAAALVARATPVARTYLKR